MIYPMIRNRKYKYKNVYRSFSGPYTEELVRRLYSLYLKTEYEGDGKGNALEHFRLKAVKDQSDSMPIEIDCPRCQSRMKQTGNSISSKTLGLYSCPCCDNKKR